MTDHDSARPGPGVRGLTTLGLDGLAPEPEPEPASCGVPGVDHATDGGVRPGELWTVAATAGRGGTAFAVDVAVALSRRRRVLVLNGHLSPHRLHARFDRLARRRHLDDAALDRLGFLPVAPRAGWADVGNLEAVLSACDLLVVDTLDETTLAGVDGHADEAADARVDRLRSLRDQARATGTAVLLTARVAGEGPFDAAWARHRWHEAFADASDVQVQLRGAADRVVLELLAKPRGRPTWRGRSMILEDEVQDGDHLLETLRG